MFFNKIFENRKHIEKRKWPEEETIRKIPRLECIYMYIKHIFDRKPVVELVQIIRLYDGHKIILFTFIITPSSISHFNNENIH